MRRGPSSDNGLSYWYGPVDAVAKPDEKMNVPAPTAVEAKAGARLGDLQSPAGTTMYHRFRSHCDVRGRNLQRPLYVDSGSSRSHRQAAQLSAEQSNASRTAIHSAVRQSAQGLREAGAMEVVTLHRTYVRCRLGSTIYDCAN